MARFRTFALLFPMVLLLGCAETASDGYNLSGYQATSWDWTMRDQTEPEVSQVNDQSITTTNAVGSVQTAEQRASADRKRMQTAAAIAIIALIALIVIADDTSACSGSGCGGGGGGIAIN